MAKINGMVIYRGPSMLDGAPIIAIATGLADNTNNEKTGALIQTWILREDVNPNDALNTGADASICGTCPHRGTIENGKNVNRSCYVTVFQAPANVWKSYHRGIYPVCADLAGTFAGRMVRLGAYGDPAAVPMYIWNSMLENAAGHTGYTHQWAKFPELAAYCMASCDNSAERVTAKMLGFRTFRVTGIDSRQDIEKYEVICPASAEKSYATNCAACKACGGNTAKAKADIVITVHGAAGKINNFKRLTA